MRRIAILLVALTVAGCSSIPDSGPIVEGARVDVVRTDGYVRVIARPPTAGMSPEALVRGFLNACASVADGDETARRYLTKKASAGWNTGRKTRVYDTGGLTVTVLGKDVVRVTAPLLGTIDARHRYHPVDPGETFSEDLQLAQEGGQWRIAVSPAALYLDRSDVVRSFRVHPVYFFNAAQTRAVPEYLLLPQAAANTAVVLAKAAISAPTDPALRGYGNRRLRVLAATTMGDFAATIVGLDRSATVSLNRAALGLSATERDGLLAQLTLTLTSLSGVFSVYVQVEGKTLASSSGRRVQTAADFSAVDSGRVSTSHRLIYVRDARMRALVDGVARPVNEAVPVSEATASMDGRMVVGVGATRKLLFVSIAGSAPSYVAAGGDLASPTMLSTDEAWFVDREAKGHLQRWSVREGVMPVQTGLPGRARILDFAIAPDEARIALVVNDGIATSVRLGTITRDAKGVRIVGLHRVEQQLTSATAIAWSGESELVALGAVGAVAVQPIRITLPLGAVSLLGGPANAVSLAAAPFATIIVGDLAGQLWEYQDSRWDAGELGAAPVYAY